MPLAPWLTNLSKSYNWRTLKNLLCWIFQEMKFLAGLVRIGHLSRNELIDVLHMLFPGKTEESILEILSKIYQEESPLNWKEGTRDPEKHKWEFFQWFSSCPIFIGGLGAISFHRLILIFVCDKKSITKIVCNSNELFHLIFVSSLYMCWFFFFFSPIGFSVDVADY